MKEVIKKSDYGIDLHTGAYHRCNHPQIRANINDKATLNLAKAFAAPIIINSDLRDGSLRQTAMEEKIPLLLYEAGEALRFDNNAIEIGVRGILNFMREIGMINSKFCEIFPQKIFVARSSSWLRAPKSGIHIARAPLGKTVKKNEIIGEIANPFGDHKTYVRADEDGMIISMSKLPLVNKGDALFHIASNEQERKKKKSLYRDYNLDINDPINAR